MKPLIWMAWPFLNLEGECGAGDVPKRFCLLNPEKLENFKGCLFYKVWPAQVCSAPSL